MSKHLDRLIQAMSNPGIYPHKPTSVRIVQTHISVVFIAGDLVYKIKKPVNFGFLDFTTLEKRKHFCEREVYLNSRFSEGVYLGVASIYDGPSGVNLQGDGPEIEVAVLMKHLPEHRTMLRMLENDLVTTEMLERLADRLAHLHAAAPTGPEIAGYGSFEVIAQNLRENYDQTKPYVGRTIDRQTHEAIFALSLKFMEDHRSLFEQRMAGGFVRDCHGDLHLDHIVILNGIILYDCIEFNDRFRYGDVASDLGFLQMDFDFRGYPAFAERIARRYADSSGDLQLLKLLSFYKAYRAYVRGKVVGFTLDEPEVFQEEKQSAVEEANRYFRLSLSYFMPQPPPFLIITCGLTGTGKSFIAARLGKRLGIEPIRSDLVRKEIHKVPPFEHRLDKYGAGIYTSRASESTYEALLERARLSLDKGESVILDASFIRRMDRRRAFELAQDLKARFLLLKCDAPGDVIRARLDRRMKEATDPSEGRWEIFQQQKVDCESIQDDEVAYCRQWDSTTNPSGFLRAVVMELIAPG
jgi:aminoglycoside phosphotransferase family enzyme/predicted kinase